MAACLCAVCVGECLDVALAQLGRMLNGPRQAAYACVLMRQRLKRPEPGSRYSSTNCHQGSCVQVMAEAREDAEGGTEEAGRSEEGPGFMSQGQQPWNNGTFKLTGSPAEVRCLAGIRQGGHTSLSCSGTISCRRARTCRGRQA